MDSITTIGIIVSGIGVWVFTALYILRQERRLKDLERRVQNVNIEVFYPLAESEIEPGKYKQRVTLNGIVDTLFKINKEKIDYMRAKENAIKKPTIHRV